MNCAAALSAKSSSYVLLLAVESRGLTPQTFWPHFFLALITVALQGDLCNERRLISLRVSLARSGSMRGTARILNSSQLGLTLMGGLIDPWVDFLLLEQEFVFILRSNLIAA